MITLKNLSKIYNSNGSVAVGLQNINITFNKGEFVGIVGPSGSGKTTLLNVVSGMDTYEEGELVLFGSETSSYTQEDFEAYRRNNVSFIFQNYQLIDSYSVLDNVVMELLFKGMDLAAAKVSAREILTRVGLAHRLKNRASKLSGGEKQRVVIARALASDCQVLACDEPTGNLDSQNSVEIINLLKEISSDKLVLMVTHEPDLIKDVATRIVTVKDGLIDSDEVITKVEEDNSSSLSQKHVNFLTRCYLGFKNIVSTPKRSILLMMVFLLLSFGVSSMVSEIVSADSSYSAYTDYLFTNISDNRIIVYNDPDVDISKYVSSAIAIENDFYFDNSFSISSYELTDLENIIYTSNYYLGVYSDNTAVDIGRLPEFKDEIVLEIPEYYFTYYLDNESLDGTTTITISNQTYDIVGIICSSNYSYKLYFNDNDYSVIESSLSYSFNSNVIATVDGQRIYTDIDKNYVTDDVSIPSSYENVDLDIFFGEVEFDWQSYDYTYVDYNDYIGLSSEVILDFLESNVCRTSYFFENEDDAIEANEKINSLGVVSTHPSSYTSGDEFSRFFNLFSIIFQLFGTGVLLGIILFVVSFITNLILKTTVRDFTIMRIIGLTKRNVLEMILFQMCMVAVSSYLLMWIVIGLLNFTNLGTELELNELIDIISGFDVMAYSIIAILLCSMYIGYRHNKKMFKSSASQNLRGGDLL